MTFTCCLSFPSIQDAYGISLAGGLQPGQPRSIDLQVLPGNKSQEKQRTGLRAETAFSLNRHKHREPDWECGESALGTAPTDESRLRRFDDSYNPTAFRCYAPAGYGLCFAKPSRSKPPSAVRSSKPHQLRCLADIFKQDVWWS